MELNWTGPGAAPNFADRFEVRNESMTTTQRSLSFYFDGQFILSIDNNPPYDPLSMVRVDYGRSNPYELLTPQEAKTAWLVWVLQRNFGFGLDSPMSTQRFDARWMAMTCGEPIARISAEQRKSLEGEFTTAWVLRVEELYGQGVAFERAVSETMGQRERAYTHWVENRLQPWCLEHGLTRVQGARAIASMEQTSAESDYVLRKALSDSNALDFARRLSEASDRLVMRERG